MKKTKLLYFYPAPKAFILSDKAILAQKYTIDSQETPWFDKKKLLLNFVKQFFYLLWYAPRTKIIVVAFGGYWSYLPMLFAKIFNKKGYIILHGTDCVSFPKLNYGMLRKAMPRYFIKKSYQWATKLLPVSESLIYTDNTFYKKGKLVRQGFQYHFPKLTTPFQVVYNGLDENKWFALPNVKRNEKQFLAAFTEQQWQLKGGDLIVQLAFHYPKSVFKIAGVSQEFIDTKKLSDNIFGLGVQSAKQMQKLYSESQYFLQLAISEGFGLALAEAMLCECVPIGANVNIVPKIIGENGYILKENDTNPLVTLVATAVTKDDKSLGKKARTHIITNFSLARREEVLISQ